MNRRQRRKQARNAQLAVLTRTMRPRAARELLRATAALRRPTPRPAHPAAAPAAGFAAAIQVMHGRTLLHRAEMAERHRLALAEAREICRPAAEHDGGLSLVDEPHPDDAEFAALYPEITRTIVHEGARNMFHRALAGCW